MCLRRNSQEENDKKLENTFIQMKIKTKHKNGWDTGKVMLKRTFIL